MKKIGSLFIAILLTVVLVSCSKDKFTAKAEVNDLEPGRVEISFKLTVTDEDNLIADDAQINVILKEMDDTVKSEKSSNKASIKSEENGESFQFTNLKENTKYRLVVTTTWKEKSRKLLEREVSTVAVNEVRLTQANIDDFFKMKESSFRYSTFILDGDLDFTEKTDMIKDNLISDFRGIFDGQEHSIKNYTIDSTNSSLGLFGQLGSEAKISNLVLDGITVKTKTNSSSQSKYIGILFGQNSSSSVEIKNITIKNSQINIDEYSSTSSYFRVGILGGVINGKIENVTIENTNTLTIKANKIGSFSSSTNGAAIGGVVGEITSNASVKNVVNAGTINLSIEQTKDKGLEGTNAKINVGGFAGVSISDINETKVSNVISKTNILVDKLAFSISKVATDVKSASVDLNIGGLFGYFNGKTSNLIYEGNITVPKLTYVKDIEDEMSYEYRRVIRVGSLIGYTPASAGSFTNLLRVNGKITIAEQDAANLSANTLFGYSEIKSFGSNEQFGYVGEITDSFTEIKGKQYATVEELFKDNESWIIKNYK
ncbi:hypothetical protein [Haploplasma axanthum]|uniref:Uncharacterized protein n=1 Tax=Haploplasma axanthum TaxID=29552 RepID=A0A449BCK8_HAPAX|nr:hypothetical protein [Haploplasma axanthum]VEU80181.1 Uncharacterised protein [Haploplasma axanthum]